jgi:hypothetical protein
MEPQTNNRIKLSIIAARYIWPMWVDPITDRRNQFANKIMQQMMGK